MPDEGVEALAGSRVDHCGRPPLPAGSGIVLKAPDLRLEVLVPQIGSELGGVPKKPWLRIHNAVQHHLAQRLDDVTR